MQNYVAPEYAKPAFHCPYCKTYSHQDWKQLQYWWNSTTFIFEGLYFTRCSHCEQDAIWFNNKMIIPNIGLATMPHVDLPEEVKSDYYEAMQVALHSSKAAAALLRLVIQKLCRSLGQEGNNIDEDIASLVSKGLNPAIQHALNTVRVVGCGSIYPGVIDSRDDLPVVQKLFELINIIVEETITRPKKIEKLYYETSDKKEILPN